ncbi:MAG TPA: DUF3465 domain-containing protein [Candidatus Aquilonibacter sp.]|nr:DUF3465 domain-containing protein [Candidatus Aquilonibacter sp.]
MAVHRRPQALRHLSLAALALALLAPLAACGGGSVGNDPPNNKRICDAYGGQLTNGEVVADGTVRQILGERRGRSGDHEGYLIQLGGDCDLVLKVETNTDITGPIPLRPGERVVVKGVYIYNPMGGLIHWTHHDPGGRHEGGFVKAGGLLYQ